MPVFGVRKKKSYESDKKLNRFKNNTFKKLADIVNISTNRYFDRRKKKSYWNNLH